MDMRGKLTLAAMAALLATACSTTDDAPGTGAGGEEKLPVVFSATGTPFAADTRSAIGSATELQASEGFGVFAYYHDGTTYAADGDKTPNFMHNQQVSYSGGAWTYSPLCFWPNEAGDRLSFLAYAPYNTTAIVGTSTVGATGTPWVEYQSVKGEPAESADLMWATPVTDKKRGDGIISFQFHHALAQLAYKMTTKTAAVKVEKVEIIGGSGNGLCVGGQLNLDNSTTTPDWRSHDHVEKHEAKDMYGTDEVYFSESFPTAITLSKDETSETKGGWMIVPTGEEQDFFVQITYTMADNDGKEIRFTIPSQLQKATFETTKIHLLTIEIP